MNLTSSVTFSVAELWLLQSVIRHEMPQQDTWKFPYASLDLNDRIAEALLFCHENDTPDAALQLSRGDTLCIDYLVRNDIKDANGVMIGKAILLKSFAARKDIAWEPYLSADAECDISISGTDAREELEKFEEFERWHANRIASRLKENKDA